MNTDEAALKIIEWCSDRPHVMNAWFFGSRVKGTHRPDSDLDIVIDFDPSWVSALPAHKSEFLQHDLKLDLTMLLGSQVDCHHRAFPPTPTLDKAILEHGMLVYQATAKNDAIPRHEHQALRSTEEPHK
jgi:predicted nucleotidyltransferase